MLTLFWFSRVYGGTLFMREATVLLIKRNAAILTKERTFFNDTLELNHVTKMPNSDSLFCGHTNVMELLISS